MIASVGACAGRVCACVCVCRPWMRSELEPLTQPLPLPLPSCPAPYCPLLPVPLLTPAPSHPADSPPAPTPPPRSPASRAVRRTCGPSPWSSGMTTWEVRGRESACVCVCVCVCVWGVLQASLPAVLRHLAAASGWPPTCCGDRTHHLPGCHLAARAPPLHAVAVGRGSCHLAIPSHNDQVAPIHQYTPATAPAPAPPHPHPPHPPHLQLAS